MMWCRLGVSLSIVVVCGSFLGCADPAAEKAKAEKGKSRVVLPGPDDPDAPKEFTTLESGLKYRIRRKSDGKKLTDDSQNASTMYRAWIVGEDGGDMIFDSTYGSTGAPRIMDGHRMLPCIKEGLKLIAEGGMIELEAPTALCFKDRDWERPVGVSPDATVRFLIELVKVIEPATPSADSGKPAIPAAAKIDVGPVDPDAPEEFTTTSSGLKYRIRRKATGKSPKMTDSVKVHYRGWLDTGGVFDSSYDTGKPAEFGLSSVIAGWGEGLQLTGEGGMIELEIPGELGYGSRGSPPSIPPNAKLHFIVEILKVK